MTELTEHPHPQLERDQGRVEGILEQMTARLDRLEDALRQEMSTLRQEMAASDHAHRQEMIALSQDHNRRLDAQLRWIIGIIIGVASLQVAVVSILLKVLT